jgi:hypothetical protein
MFFAHPKKRKSPTSFSCQLTGVLHGTRPPQFSFKERIHRFFRLYHAAESPDLVADSEGAGAQQNEEEDVSNESATPPTPFSWAFSAFAKVEWSWLSPEDWTLFITSPLLGIAYDTLTSCDEGEFDDVVVALARPLEWMTPEDWSKIQVSGPKGSLTDVVLNAVLGWGSGEADVALPVISSLVRLTNDERFSEHVLEAVRGWVELLLGSNPRKAPESLWLFLRSVGSVPFPEFFTWFSGSFLGPFLLKLVNSPFKSRICPDLVQFLILVWDHDPDSHSLFIANGVPAFLGRRLLRSEARDLPQISLRLLARCSSESEGCFPFPPEMLFECLCWEEPQIESAFAIADLFVVQRCLGWKSYLHASSLEGLAHYLMEGSVETKRMALKFFGTLLRACHAEIMPLDPFLPFTSLIYGLWSDSGQGDDDDYRALCLLARWFLEANLAEDDISPFTPPSCSTEDFLTLLAELCQAEETSWVEIPWVVAAVANEVDASELPEL